MPASLATDSGLTLMHQIAFFEKRGRHFLWTSKYGHLGSGMPYAIGAMLQAGLIDELVIYMAPHLLGDGARGLLHLPGLERMAQKIAFKIEDIRKVGQDWRITAVPA